MAQYDPTVTRGVSNDDCSEVDQLNETPAESEEDCRVAKNCQCAPDDVQCQGSPIIINLGSGEYRLSGPEDPVSFDMNADGRIETMTWTARGADMAFLWLDRNGDGVVNDGEELFGNYTPMSDGHIAPNGFEALRDFDANGDGVIDSSDPVWQQLKLWVDLNHDGFAQVSEILPIDRSSVRAISLAYHRTNRRDRYGNMFRFESRVTIADPFGRNSDRPVYDIFFYRLAR